MKIKAIFIFLCMTIIQTQAQFLTYPAWSATDIKAQKIYSTADGFVLSGSTNTTGVYGGFIIKIDLTGVIQWNKLFIDSNLTENNIISVNGGLSHLNGGGTGGTWRLNRIFVSGQASSRVFVKELNSTTGAQYLSYEAVGLANDSIKIGSDSNDSMDTWMGIGSMKIANIFLPVIFVPLSSVFPNSSLHWYQGPGMQLQGNGLTIAGNDSDHVAVCKLDTSAYNLGICGFKYPNGPHVWAKRYDFDVLTANIDSTTDGGYILTGSTVNNKAYLMKINHIGEIEFTKTYPQTTEGVHVVEDSQGFVLLGNTSSFGQSAAFIMRTDGTGIPFWSQRLGDLTYAGDIAKLGSGFIITGQVQSSPGVYYPFISISDSIGNNCYQSSSVTITQQIHPIPWISAQCNLISTINSNPPELGMQISQPTLLGTDLCLTNGITEKSIKEDAIYPNPFINKINFGKNDYRVFDVCGRMLLSGKTDGWVDLSELDNGIYFVSLPKNSNAMAKRIIKVN